MKKFTNTYFYLRHIFSVLHWDVQVGNLKINFFVKKKIFIHKKRFIFLTSNLSKNFVKS